MVNAARRSAKVETFFISFVPSIMSSTMKAGMAAYVTTLWLDVNFLDLVNTSDVVPDIVLGLLAVASVFSWTVIIAKWLMLRGARDSNRKFLRAFRKATRLDAVAAASEQFRAAPLVGVFDFGYSEVCRQMAARSRISNPVALERTLQLGISEEISRLEQNMSWLATIASVSPFVGLFGTVLGIIEAFQGLGAAGTPSMRAVGPGIAKALIATAMGLFAAIPASIFYNYFGSRIREIGARMEDFSLEFLNLTERNLEE
jgi:biopolymer transport protein TolQ